MAKRGPRATSVATSSSMAHQTRCAIYTRKSTEEGLEQEFNSLDAQREACAAYVTSQRHEGWTLLPAVYDDGGFSGGNMERPALRRLLADVESGRVDVIVVYKVDRLTRALSDFAKIVEVLDARGASFVSVTQAFNTTTSMGRLTLNVLLSFAQFEREVTGERIRDKIAASKKKGMWMGGPVPLGYDVVERKLVVNEAEAETVRLIFERYQTLESINALTADLKLRGVVSKRRTMRDGRITGGTAYNAGALGYLLRNVLYTGRVPHGDQVYDGEHQAIVPRELWDTAQVLLAGNAPRPGTGERSLLGGILHDEHGRAMVTQHANKAGRRYRYYVSRPPEGSPERAWRIPAGDLDAIVSGSMLRFLRDPALVGAELGSRHGPSVQTIERCAVLAEQVDQPHGHRALLEQLEARVHLSSNTVTLLLDPRGLARLVGIDHTGTAGTDTIELRHPVALKRRGHELRLIYAVPDARPAQRDDRLIQLLASGRAAYERLQSGPANMSATRRSHLSRLARLRFLAPDIVTAILEGRQPVELTSRTLLRLGEMPMEWQAQRLLLGFA
ncbi:recombinase family protein [Sphingomonas profundi]|uniref:recombinase family protein n=1 Tax=Alterirhizorhabdus profundi TaxID=2681549 RepID=UPI001E3A82C9|nr:recombinase family protein [Sphingomonas profundi]